MYWSSSTCQYVKASLPVRLYRYDNPRDRKKRMNAPLDPYIMPYNCTYTWYVPLAPDCWKHPRHITHAIIHTFSLLPSRGKPVIFQRVVAGGATDQYLMVLLWGVLETASEHQTCLLLIIYIFRYQSRYDRQLRVSGLHPIPPTPKPAKYNTTYE